MLRQPVKGGRIGNGHDCQGLCCFFNFFFFLALALPVGESVLTDGWDYDG